jgi:hypothetical protein
MSRSLPRARGCEETEEALAAKGKGQAGLYGM